MKHDISTHFTHTMKHNV